MSRLHEIAMAVATDVANRQMRTRGDVVWDFVDLRCARATYDRVMALGKTQRRAKRGRKRGAK